MSFCPNCGTAIVQGTQFCGGCGGSLVEGTSAGSAPYAGAVYTPPKPAGPQWKFAPLGDSPTVSWILYFAAIIVEALAQACQWGGGIGRLQFLLSMAAGITVVVGLALAFKALRASGQQLSAILLLVGFSVSSLGELTRFISWRTYDESIWDLGVFALTIGALTIAAGFFFLIFRPEKPSAT